MEIFRKFASMSLGFWAFARRRGDYSRNETKALDTELHCLSVAGTFLSREFATQPKTCE